MTDKLTMPNTLDILFREAFPLLEDGRPASGFSPRRQCVEGGNDRMVAKILGISEQELASALAGTPKAAS